MIDWLFFGPHISSTNLRLSGQPHSWETPCWSDSIGFHWGRHLSKLNSVILIGQDGSWWYSLNTHTFQLESPSSNGAFDKGYSPMMSSNENECYLLAREMSGRHNSKARTFLLHPKTVIFQVVFNFIVIGQPNFGTGHCPSLIAWPSRFYNPSGYLIVLTVYSSLPLCRLLAPSAEINKPVWLVSVFSTETVEDLVSDLAASVTASVSSYSVLYCTTPSIDVLNFPPLSGVILPLALTSCRLCVFRQLCQRDRTWME